MESLEGLDRLVSRSDSYVIEGNSRWCGSGLSSTTALGCGKRLVGPYDKQIAEDQSRIGDVQVRAFPDGLFHAVHKIPQSTGHSLTRDGKDRPDASLGDNHIDGLSLEPAKNRGLAACRHRRVKFKTACSPSLHGDKWRTWGNLLRPKASFKHQARRHVPMKGLYVALALRFPLVGDELSDRVGPIHPLADIWRSAHRDISPRRHNASKSAS